METSLHKGKIFLASAALPERSLALFIGLFSIENQKAGGCYSSMNHPLEISEVVGVFDREGQTIEVCGTASARFDSETSRLEVTLEAFLRPVDLLHPERHESAPWLPPREVIREGVAWEESNQLAREIFHRWVKKVRGAIPVPVRP